MRTVSPVTTSVTILIPRATLDEVLPPFDMHGLVLDATAGKLLSDYIRALILRLPALEAPDAPAIARGTRDLIAATLSTARRHAPAAGTDSALLVRAKRHISRHLNTTLDAETLCAALATSRSSLFRAFEPLGGLARYVRSRRLAHAHEILARPDESRTVAEIAFACGFKSPAHFSRAFREVYGVSPTDLQDRRATSMLPPPGPAGDTHLTYAEWHRRLR
jgi:AraC-like DNA-binding protein